MIHGRCFATQTETLSPGYIYAQIGAVIHKVTWYKISQEWQALLEDSDAKIEIHLILGTNWVEKVTAEN